MAMIPSRFGWEKGEREGGMGLYYTLSKGGRGHITLAPAKALMKAKHCTHLTDFTFAFLVISRAH